MNPAYSSSPRQTQTLRCCGLIYRRWRFVGKHFPDSFPEKCCVCEGHLNWPVNYRAHDRKADARELARDRSVKFLAEGLTTNGQPRQRHPNFFNRAEVSCATRLAEMKSKQRAHIRTRVLKNYHLRSQRLAKQGLTTRGTKRKRAAGLYQPTPLDQSWQQLRSEINVGRVSWEDAK